MWVSAPIRAFHFALLPSLHLRRRRSGLSCSLVIPKIKVADEGNMALRSARLSRGEGTAVRRLDDGRHLRGTGGAELPEEIQVVAACRVFQPRIASSTSARQPVFRRQNGNRFEAIVDPFLALRLNAAATGRVERATIARAVVSEAGQQVRSSVSRIAQLRERRPAYEH